MQHSVKSIKKIKIKSETKTYIKYLSWKRNAKFYEFGNNYNSELKK